MAHSMNLDRSAHIATIRQPTALHRAFLHGVHKAIAAQFTKLSQRGLPFSNVANRIMRAKDFPMGTTPRGGTTHVDVCYSLLNTDAIGLAMMVIDSTMRKDLKYIVESILLRGDRSVRRLVLFDLGSQADRSMKYAALQHWRGEPLGKDKDGKPIWRVDMVDEQLIRGYTEPEVGNAGVLVLPMQLFRGRVMTGEIVDPNVFIPVWNEEVTIPLKELRQILEEEESKVRAAVQSSPDATHEILVGGLGDDWEIAEVEDADEWEMVHDEEKEL